MKRQSEMVAFFGGLSGILTFLPDGAASRS